VAVTADPVLALDPVNKETGGALLDKLQLKGHGPLIGFSVREWKGHAHYKNVFAAAADRLICESGARIVFLPMQWPDDLQAARLVASRMKQPCGLLEGKYGTEELLSIVGSLDLLVGVRLHALIFAAVMDTPFVGVSYDPKIDSFLETFGVRHAGTLDTLATESLLEQIAQTGSNSMAAEGRRRKLLELRELALANAKHAMDLILRTACKTPPS
jgi:polysaccharide pyruvyl transferase WcaK-like protein